MGYTDDWFEADATGAFPAFGHPGSEEVRYADSGLLPDDVLPASDARLPGARRPVGTRVAHGREIAHESPLTDAGRHALDHRLTGSDRLTEWGAAGGFPADTFPEMDTSSCGGFPRGRRDLDADIVTDWYAGYEQFAGELDDQPGQPPAEAEEEPLIRAYARPTDPREVPGPPGAPPVTGEGHRAGERLADGGYLSEPPVEEFPARSSLTERIVRLRPDRWLIAGGGLAAAAAVVVAFVMAGGSGSAGTPGSGTAQTATTQTGAAQAGAAQAGTMQTGTTNATTPVCVTPAPGH